MPRYPTTVAMAPNDAPTLNGLPNTAVNQRGPRRPRRPAAVGGLLALTLLGATALTPVAARAAEGDAVRVWNANAMTALTNATTNPVPGAQFAPPVAAIQLAIVQGAVYDAVNSIKGGFDPYLGTPVTEKINASPDAAAATAAHDVLIALIDQAPITATLTQGVKDAIKARLDAEYAASLAEIPAGRQKRRGVEQGAQAAAAMLADRVGDGRFGAPGFPVPASPGPGQWRPLGPAFVNDPNGWIRTVQPFTLPSSEFYHTSGPAALNSAQYTTEFNEVKALGRATGSTRTDAQTSLAYWSAGHPIPMFNAALREVSVSKGLNIRQDARLFAMTSMAGADSIINCWAEKAHWSFWRPTSAIQLADTDGNPGTSEDTAWTALIAVPPYPDEPSGANCLAAGIMYAAKGFFRTDRATFSVTSPGIGPGTGSTRNYTRFTDVVADMIEARIYAGLHFRRADVNGALLGQRVALYVDDNFFNCGSPRPCDGD